jgi:hypothetical protein
MNDFEILVNISFDSYEKNKSSNIFFPSISLILRPQQNKLTWEERLNLEKRER